MKAVGVVRFGGPEVLEVFDLPEPRVGRDEVRIRVHAAAVNPGDRYVRSGALAVGAGRAPYIPGMDAAGVVDQIGPDARTDLEIGERVMAVTMPTSRHGGAYAQYLSVPAQWVTRAPAGSSHVEAATVPMNGLTARLALDLLSLAPGGFLAVTGGAGAVGGYTIQLAKADKLQVVSDAAVRDRDLIEALGANLVVPRNTDTARWIRLTVPGGVDGLLDAAVLGSARMAAAVRDGGAIASLLGEGPQALGADERGRRRLRHHHVFVPDAMGDRSRLDRLRSQVEQGVLTPRVAQALPAEQAAQAHRRMEAGGVRGRLVLTF